MVLLFQSERSRGSKMPIRTKKGNTDSEDAANILLYIAKKILLPLPETETVPQPSEYNQQNHSQMQNSAGKLSFSGGKLH